MSQTTRCRRGRAAARSSQAGLTQRARAGDLDDVIRVIDEFCYERSFMINVGDEKGELLDAAVRRAFEDVDGNPLILHNRYAPKSARPG